MSDETENQELGAGFETTATGPVAVEHGDMSDEMLKQAADKNQVILNLIEKNRKAGLERLLRATEQLQEVGKTNDDPDLESRLREIEAGLNAAATTLEANDSLVNIIKQDLVHSIMNVEKVSKMQMHQGMHLQTLIALLEGKDLVSQAELEDTWNTLLKAQQQAQG